MGERKVKVTQSDSLGPHGLYSPWTFPGQNTGGIEPRSPTLQVDSLPSEPQGKPHTVVMYLHAMQETQEMQVQPLGWEYPLEEDMATHSSVLARKIPSTEEPGGLQSVWSQRVGHD